MYVFEAELNYGNNVQQDVRSKDGVNQMNASVTMRQAGQSSVQIVYCNFNNFFPFLKCVLCVQM